MAPLCKLVRRGAVRANDLPLSNDLEAWPDSSVGRAPTYKVRGREFESRSGRLFSHTFTFQNENVAIAQRLVADQLQPINQSMNT